MKKGGMETATANPDLLTVSFSGMMEKLADALDVPSNWEVGKVAEDLIKKALNISGAEVAYLRDVRDADLLELASQVHWVADRKELDGNQPEGNVAKTKHRTVCGMDFDSSQQDYSLPIVKRRNHKLDDIARLEKRGDNPFYDEAELRHFEWLNSECFLPLGLNHGIPKAVIVLGHSDPHHFDDLRTFLEVHHPFFKAAYRLADLTQDRLEKASLLQNIAKVIPLIVGAKSRIAFVRAVCTLLTCNGGLGFNRAMLFWMENRQLPAKCEMALGGTGETWTQEWEGILEKFKNAGLNGYIQEALRNPVPDSGPEPDDIPDPLYAATSGHPDGFVFQESDGGKILDVLFHGAQSAVRAIRLDHSDPWISRIRAERPGVFCAGNDEYFLFPLRPFGADSRDALLGFVIADSAYLPWKHMPGRGAPDLEMTSFVLNLLAALWLGLEQGEQYLHTLAAIPILRHRAPDLSQAVEKLKMTVEDGKDKRNIQVDDLEELAEISQQFGVAKDIVEGLTVYHLGQNVVNLGATLSELVSDLSLQYNAKITIGSSYNGEVRMRPDMLKSILACLVNNAVTHGKRRRGEVNIKISTTVHDVPEPNRQQKKRVLIKVANDGIRIPKKLLPFLFSDRVSTNASENNQGTGLSSARAQARACGGDVVILSHDPVRFGVVLDLPITRS